MVSRCCGFPVPVQLFIIIVSWLKKSSYENMLSSSPPAVKRNLLLTAFVLDIVMHGISLGSKSKNCGSGVGGFTAFAFTFRWLRRVVASFSIFKISIVVIN